mmetsp:Transcript_4903/g.11219  ORF Transcript_4903/g.11219 Transcript_4903/m.11219 type:complete len:233 (+) Transcript_4903:1427-2125(+)
MATAHHITIRVANVVWFGNNLFIDTCSFSVDNVISRWTNGGGRRGLGSWKLGWKWRWLWRRPLRRQLCRHPRNLQISHLVRTPVPRGTLIIRMILITTRHGRIENVFTLLILPILWKVWVVGAPVAGALVGNPYCTIAPSRADVWVDATSTIVIFARGRITCEEEVTALLGVGMEHCILLIGAEPLAGVIVIICTSILCTYIRMPARTDTIPICHACRRRCRATAIQDIGGT